ncbi:hypothetical protein E4P29_07110 [Rhodococcus sp. 1R11]|uniref:Hsp70 family protein n=1 Tax=Rhodococcus sp. 1R11 TaxID=2559614 RepID=UPI00107288DB|nr:Hsp70 family protein [Rhodococcus sp. 1R11]TFI44526.1 hypothetical protein E4P29_07110 [Rhodococcus sp. 1R11]
MTGAGHLGITIGNTRSVAVYRDSTAFEPTVVVLPTTLRFDDDGRAHLGESVDTAPFTRFVDLVGKQEDLEPDADAYRAEDLMANAANCLVTMFSETSESASRPVTTMTYPTRWHRENIALLRDALDHTGLTDVALVPEAKAASAFAQPSPGAAVTVIDIGATGTDISTYPGGGTERTTAVGGDVFTDALFDHVVTDREHLDLSDAAVLASLTGIVASCEQAKHTLSTADVATIAVELPGVSDTTTVTRAEFADLIAPTLGLLDVPSTGTVVLTGGSAALPPVVADIGERTAGALLVEPLAAARGALNIAEVEDVDGNSLVTGAAPVVTRNDGTDSLDTDAIPVVAPPPPLAFSEAIPAVAPVFGPSQLRSEPIVPVEDPDGSGPATHYAATATAIAGAATENKKERSERSRTVTTIIAGAGAGVVIVLVIAALSGVFSSGPATTPPTVTDAGSPVTTSARVASTAPTSTTVPAAAPEVVQEPTAEEYTAPQPAPLPAPPPAPVPAPAPTSAPVVTTPPVAVTTTPETTTPAETTTPVTTTTTTTTSATTPEP